MGRRVLLVLGIVLLLCGVAVTLIPFDVTVDLGVPTAPTVSSSCGPPILEAWREDRGGWFGYAPLGDEPSTPKVRAHTGCRTPARQRLWFGVAGIGLGVAILAYPRFRSRAHRSESDQIEGQAAASPSS